MCSECGFFNCACACPNAPDEEAVYYCAESGEAIYYGDVYYEIGGEIYSETGINIFMKVAE